MKTTRRNVLTFGMGAFLSSTLFVGCSFARPSAQLTCIVGINSPFYHMIETGAQQEAQKKGALLQVEAPAQWDTNLQKQMVQASIARRVNVLIISPTDSQALIGPLKQASDAGIKVITVDTFLGDGNYAIGRVRFPETFIGSDNIEGGRMAARAFIKAIGGRGSVYIQSTGQGTSTTDQREQGFKEVLNTTNGAVTLVGTGYDNGSIDLAAKQTLAILQREPGLSGIFGTGDYSTKGAMQAIERRGRSGQIKVVRFDSSQEALRDLREGRVDLVIGQQPKLMGSLAVDYALRALAGDATVPRRVTTGFIVIDKQNAHTQEAQAAVYK